MPAGANILAFARKNNDDGDRRRRPTLACATKVRRNILATQQKINSHIYIYYIQGRPESGHIGKPPPPRRRKDFPMAGPGPRMGRQSDIGGHFSEFRFIFGRWTLRPKSNTSRILQKYGKSDHRAPNYWFSDDFWYHIGFFLCLNLWFSCNS